jgi:hypothetical protein
MSMRRIEPSFVERQAEMTPLALGMDAHAATTDPTRNSATAPRMTLILLLISLSSPSGDQ